MCTADLGSADLGSEQRFGRWENFGLEYTKISGEKDNNGTIIDIIE